jgi:hypothetical protein
MARVPVKARPYNILAPGGVHKHIQSRKPIKAPSEDSLPPRITNKLREGGWRYHGKRKMWIAPKGPNVRLPQGVTKAPQLS